MAPSMDQLLRTGSDELATFRFRFIARQKGPEKKGAEAP
jgi:hypothetical protein